MEELRTVLDGLHNRKNVSLHRLSLDVGRSYTKIWGLYKALGIHMRSVAEANTMSAEVRSKHKRYPFSGTEEDRAYMVGFAKGDLTPWQVSGTSVMVTASTTHPAFARLFHDLFDFYGHVYQYPMFEEVKGYKWRLGVRLDNSFRFLLADAKDSALQFSSDWKLFSSWLAGVLDSDGGIEICRSNESVRIKLSISNEDLDLLKDIKTTLKKEAYHPVGPYLQFRKGTAIPAWNITYSQDFWRLYLERTAEAQRLLRELPLRHTEKVQKKQVALSVRGGDSWQDVKQVVLSIRSDIDRQVSDFVLKAQVQMAERSASRGNSLTGSRRSKR